MFDFINKLKRISEIQKKAYQHNLDILKSNDTEVLKTLNLKNSNSGEITITNKFVVLRAGFWFGKTYIFPVSEFDQIKIKPKSDDKNNVSFIFTKPDMYWNEAIIDYKNISDEKRDALMDDINNMLLKDTLKDSAI